MGQREILDAVILQDRGGALVVPPQGARTIQVAGTTVTQVNPDGTTSPIGGSSASPAWRAAAFAFLKAKVSAVGADFLMDFDRGSSNSTLEYDTAGTGGTLTLAANVRGGVVQSATGASATNSVIVLPKGSPPLLVNPKTERWGMVTRQAIQGPIDANANLMLAGVFHTAINAYAGLWIDGTVSTTNLILKVVNGATTTVTTSIAIPALNTFFDFACWFDLTTFFGSVGQVLGTMTDAPETLTNLTNFPSSASTPALQHQTLNTTVRNMYIDKMLLAYELAA